MNDSAKSVHLSASAGSGKTRALKERYVALLERLDGRGLGLDQAVAITFTDKAAAEIKDRVMADLPEAMLRKIIRGRQELRISTIHSFCMNLLKRYPLEAGLPPDFGVLDTRDQAQKIRTAIEDAIEESDRDRDLMAPLSGFSADDLVDTLVYLFSIRSRLERLAIDAGGPAGLLSSVAAGMGSDRAEADCTALVSGGEWRRVLRRMADILKPLGDLYDRSAGAEHLLLSEAEDCDAAHTAAAALDRTYFTAQDGPKKHPFIPKKDFKAGNRQEYESLYRRIQEMLSAFREYSGRARAGREAASLLALYLRAEKHYGESKLREGVLDFDDLEIHAYRLLGGAESPDILYWLDRKILHFLVDEFQDTSDIQWAVLARLTEEIFAGRGADKPMSPTLFIVGDTKQSIYRFREANYRLIDDVRGRMERNLPEEMREIRTLDRNYRSGAAVVGTANRVFGALWGNEYHPSETDRQGNPGSVRLIEISPQPSAGSGSAPSEAAVLAAEIRRLVDGGTTVFRKDDGGAERKAGYGDCAVLIQSRTRLKEYETALQSDNIPFRVVGGIGFYEEDEILAVLNTLFFLWNRDDRLSLAAALKSPLFGLSNGEIAGIFTPAAGDPLAELRNVRPREADLLHRWALLARVEPLAGLIHRIINDTGAFLRFGRLNPQAIFNLDKLLDTAREFDRRGYTTLQDFVDWVRNIREAEQREATADLNLPGFEGAVSIMTVHKAKGLEFPVVFLPGMNQPPRSVSQGPPAIIDAEGSVRVGLKDRSSPVYRELWEREREELNREHQRLFYVAMTRSRDHLVMIGTLAGPDKPAKPFSWLEYLRTALPPDRGAVRGPGTLSVSSFPDWRVEPMPFEAAASKQTANVRRAAAINPETVLGNISPVPAFKTLEWKKATDFLAEDEELGPAQNAGPFIGNVSRLTRGSMLHRCLETYTRTGAWDGEATAAEFPEISSLDGPSRGAFLKEVESVLTAVTGRTDLGWIFERGENAYSELPFLHHRRDAVVSGIIDRVIVRGAEGFVVDYKAILLESEQALASWREHYRPQIQLYCEAAKHLFGLDSVKGYLLFLDSARLERLL